VSRLQSKAAYKGLDSHLHVTISAKQELKVRKLAKRAGLSLSAYMRGVIDELK